MPDLIYFYSEGTKVAGHWYAAEGKEPRAVVVLCNGFSAVKEMVMPDVARDLTAAGYHALAIDYRFFGDSEGEPRGRIIPIDQVRDIRAAITYAQSRPEVDPERVALWGCSFGGGNAVYTAAHDPRVRCVVAHVGVMRGPRWLRSLRGPEQWNQLLDRLDEDRRERVLSGKSADVRQDEILPFDSETGPFIRKHWGKVRNLPMTVKLESADAVLEFDPQSVIRRISPRPLLMIAVEREQIVPNEETTEAYAAAGEPKKLVWLPRRYGHWGADVGEGLQRAVEESLAWYQEWLPPHRA